MFSIPAKGDVSIGCSAMSQFRFRTRMVPASFGFRFAALRASEALRSSSVMRIPARALRPRRCTLPSTAQREISISAAMTVADASVSHLFLRYSMRSSVQLDILAPEVVDDFSDRLSDIRVNKNEAGNFANGVQDRGVILAAETAADCG